MPRILFSDWKLSLNRFAELINRENSPRDGNRKLHWIRRCDVIV